MKASTAFPAWTRTVDAKEGDDQFAAACGLKRQGQRTDDLSGGRKLGDELLDGVGTDNVGSYRERKS